MADFDCSIATKCKSDCCGLVIMPTDIWERNKALAQRPLKELSILGEECVPITGDLLCIFLDSNHRCAIYNDRPDVCKEYGLNDDLPCPWIKTNGHLRSPAKQRQMQRKINHHVDGQLETIRKRCHR